MADGVADKDAVNVSQLKQLADKVDTNKDNIATNTANIAKIQKQLVARFP